MSTARRSSCFLSVLLFLQMNGVPSLAQTKTTVQPAIEPTTTISSVRLSSPTLAILTTPSSSPPPSSSPILPLEAIIGIAVGGGALLICIVMASLCLCICCPCCKRRRNKNFDPSDTMKKTLDDDSPTYRTLTPPQDLDHKEESNDEFEMQVNVAHSTEGVSSNHNLRPGELFGIKKSASSSQICETSFNNAGTSAPNSSNTDALSSSQPPELKGYVKMSAAGSVRPSRSVGDIAGLEQDVGIYVEPNQTGATLLVEAESYNDPPSHPPPKLHPKTASISAMIAAENAAASRHYQGLLPTTEETDGGEYEAPDVFRMDRQTQEEIDSYYNKDTIESIRQGRGLTDVVDPSDSIYTNVNSSSSTPTHHVKVIGESQHTGSREDKGSAAGAAAKSLPGAAAAVKEVEKEEEHNSGEEGYYNVRRQSDDEDKYEYYNSVKGIGGGSSQPLLDSEDDQYVYIEKSEVSRPASSTVSTAKAGKPTVAIKPRHLTSPNTSAQPRKYVNLGPNQRQVLQEKSKENREASASPTPKHRTTPPPMTNGARVSGSSDDIDESVDQPLYANLLEGDEGGKEIYANIL